MPASYRPQRAHLREPSTTAKFVRHRHYGAAEIAIQRARLTVEKSSVKPIKAISQTKIYEVLTDEEWVMLDHLLRSDQAWGDLSLANPQTRYRMQHALIHALLNHFDNIFAQPDCRTFLATFAWDAGMASIEAPLLPIDSMRRTVHRTLKRLGLSGVGNFEFDVLRKKLLGESFRRLSAQAHIVCWTSDGRFAPEAKAKLLSASGRFPNMLDIPAVDIVSRARSEVRRGLKKRESPGKDQTPKSIGHVGYYITKAKNYSLNRIPAGPGRSRPKLLPDEKHFTLTDALRLADINSRFDPEASLFAFGQGNDVKQDFQRIFRSTAPARQSRHAELDRALIEGTFAKIWTARNCEPTSIF